MRGVIGRGGRRDGELGMGDGDWGGSEGTGGLWDSRFEGRRDLPSNVEDGGYAKLAEGLPVAGIVF